MLGTAVFFSTLLAAGGDTGAVPLPDRQTRAMLGRMMVTERFVGSGEEREGRGAVGRYFSRQEYARLHGNPVLGYWDVGTFAWVGGRKIVWGGIRAGHRSARLISRRAWDAAIRQVATKQGLELRPDAGVLVEGACVAAVVDATEREPVPGVLLEVRLKSPSGTLLYRVGVGKATVEDAMGAALDLVIAFGRSLEEPGEGVARGTAR